MAKVNVDIQVTGAKEGARDVKKLSDEFLKLQSKGRTSNTGGLGASLSQLGSQAAGAAKSLGQVQVPLKAIGTGIGVVAAGVAAVAGAFGAAAASVINFADPLQDLANKAQVSTQWLQEMRIASTQVGVPLESVANAALKLQVNIGKAGEVSKEVTDALGALGLSVSELKSLSPEQQFEAVASAIAGIENPTTQASVAMALFGKQGLALLPLIRSEYQAVTAEARNLGIILDQDVIAAADRMGDRFTILQQAVTATGHQFGGAIIQSEAFQAAVEFLIASVGELNQFIIANSSEIQSWVTAGILVAAGAIEGTLTFVGALVTGLGVLGETVLNLQKFFIDLSIAILKSPFASLIPGVALFRQEMLGVAESMAANIDKGIAFTQGIQQVGHGIDSVGQKFADFRGNVLLQIQAGEQAATTQKKLAVDLGNTGNVMDATAQKALKLAETLGFAGVQREADAATLAIQGLGGVANLSATGLQSLSGVIENMRKNALELTPELRAVALELDKIALNKGMFEVAKQMEPLPLLTQDWRVGLETIPPNLEHIEANLIAAAGPPAQEMVGGIEKKTFDWNNAMDTVNDVLSEARGFMTLLGVEADSAFGKILGWVSKAFDAFNSLSGMVSKIGGAFGALTGGGGGATGGILGGLGKLFGLGGGAAAAAGTAGTAAAGTAGTAAAATGGIGGALGGIGSAISSGASAVMSGISSVLAAVPVAGWIALAGVGVGFLIKGLFGGRDAETVAEEAGRDLGVTISESLAKSIHDSGKNIQLFLPEVFAEGKMDINRFAEEVGDIYSGLQQGLFSSDEASTALSRSSEVLLANIQNVGNEGVLQMERILAAAQQTGVGFEGMDQFAAAYVQRAGELGIAVNDVVLRALGLDAALGQVAATAGGVDASFAALPETAAVAVDGISTAFNEGSAAITEGLGPVSDKIANEIREAGTTTSAAIGTSFAQTNTAIQMGLGQVSTTFTQGVAPAALQAAQATASIADAARAAASAAASIRFPDAPNYSGVGAIPGFQHGGFVPETRPHGRLVRVAEPGTGGEFMTPRRGNRHGLGMGTINMGSIHVTVNGGASKSDVDQLLAAIQANERQSQAKLRKMLGIR